MKILLSAKILIVGISFIIFAGVSAASAQFEGTLDINRYSVSSDGDESLKANYNLSFNSDRILFSNAEGAEDLDMMGAIEANRIIIRHDSEDFVFLGRRPEAVVLKKEELLTMIRLMENVKGLNQEDEEQQNVDIGVEFTQTSETKAINGYRAQKWLMQNENSNEVFHVWLTRDINIEWGLLSEPWLTDLTLFSDLPFAEWMSQGETPILVERFVEEKITDRVAIENINQRNLGNGHFDIPSGVEVLNFQQLLMKRMSGQ